MPKISICVPAHRGMKNHDLFLDRLVKSVERQTFRDYELVITYEGKMAANTNAAMRQAKGKYIKLLYLDDYFTDERSLAEIVEKMEETDAVWLASGCVHDDGENKYLNPHLPYYHSEMLHGVNTVGSPSVVTIKNGLDEFFDEKLLFLLDCDLYYRLNKKFGPPALLNTLNVTIGTGPHQTTNLMSDEEKQAEFIYLTKKYI